MAQDDNQPLDSLWLGLLTFTHNIFNKARIQTALVKMERDVMQRARISAFQTKAIAKQPLFPVSETGGWVGNKFNNDFLKREKEKVQKS